MGPGRRRGASAESLLCLYPSRSATCWPDSWIESRESAAAGPSPAARRRGPRSDDFRSSPMTYTQSFAVVHRLRDGLIVEADYYLDREQALGVAGLRE